MNELIRKAAELAGWLEVDEEGPYLQIPAQPFSAYLDEIKAPCYEYLLDALAAQLVRQVDALDGYSFESSFDGLTWIISNDLEFRSSGSVLVEIEGPDRTMNTIKAIVESGALNG